MKKIGWINDFTLDQHQGGAQRTNQSMIDVGHQLFDLEITQIGVDTIADVSLSSFDLLIVNNIAHIAIKHPHTLEEIIFKHHYVRYEHDYFIHDLSKDLYHNAKFNIFLSPIHLEECVDTIGLSIGSYFIQPSPVDSDLFSIDPKVKRKKNLVLWAGDARQHKGLDNVLAIADEQPERQFAFATVSGLSYWHNQIKIRKNCFLLGKLSHQELTKYMSYANYYIHLPNWIEPFGRVVAEAYLSGCNLLCSQNIGFLSYGWDLQADYELIKKTIDPQHAGRHFWENIFERL